jgi:hypothetical protein
MLQLKCPKCGSTRIHYGYNQSPIYKRVFGIQNLLCNGCNLLFTAFALPGAIKQHSRRKRRHSNHLVENSEQRAKTRTALDLAYIERAIDALGTDVARKQPVTAAQGLAPPVLPAMSEPRQTSVETPLKQMISTVAGETREASASGSATEAHPRHKRRRSKTPAQEAAPRSANVADYARFGVFYTGLLVKHKLGIRKTSHSLEMKFRWRNWWHWQRQKAK